MHSPYLFTEEDHLSMTGGRASDLTLMFNVVEGQLNWLRQRNDIKWEFMERFHEEVVNLRSQIVLRLLIPTQWNRASDRDLERMVGRYFSTPLLSSESKLHHDWRKWFIKWIERRRSVQAREDLEANIKKRKPLPLVKESYAMGCGLPGKPAEAEEWRAGPTQCEPSNESKKPEGTPQQTSV